MTCGALGFGLALHPLTPMAAVAGGILGIAAGAGLAHGKLVWRLTVAGSAVFAWLALAPSWPVLVGISAILAVGLALGGPRGLRGVVGVLVGAVSVLVAIWCALRIGGAQQTAAWSPLGTTAVSAAAMGLVGVLATLPRHITIGFDPIRAAVRRLPASLDREVRELCDRSVAIWTTARQRFEDDDAGRQLVRDGVLRALEVATRSADVKLPGATDGDLETRMRDLDQRVAAASDPEVRTQYQAARSALDDQQRYRNHIRQGHARLVARLHNHVAALEKFELAVTGLAAARAGAPALARTARSTDLQAGRTEVPASRSESFAEEALLAELLHDVTASGDALAELESVDSLV